MRVKRWTGWTLDYHGVWSVLGIVLILSASGLGAASAQESDLTLAVPEHMIEEGFTKHILPRFRFKTRIRIDAVAEGSPSDIRLAPDAGGRAILSNKDGLTYRLDLDAAGSNMPKAEKFLSWLQSAPGRAAIEGFKIEGEPVYNPGAAKVVAKVEIKTEGDAEEGRKLANFHCGRCHVVDPAKPFAGIGSTPSFAAIKSLPNWDVRFAAFWTINPHPSFTQVEGMTEPFDPARPPHIAPVEMTLDDVEAISAFVSEIEAKDLGAAVEVK